MIDTTLAHVIHSLRQNQTYIAKVVSLILLIQGCLLVAAAITLYAIPLEQFFLLLSAAILGVAFLLSVVAIYLVVEMARNDLRLPPEPDQ